MERGEHKGIAEGSIKTDEERRKRRQSRANGKDLETHQELAGTRRGRYQAAGIFTPVTSHERLPGPKRGIA